MNIEQLSKYEEHVVIGALQKILKLNIDWNMLDERTPTTLPFMMENAVLFSEIAAELTSVPKLYEKNLAIKMAEIEALELNMKPPDMEPAEWMFHRFRVSSDQTEDPMRKLTMAITYFPIINKYLQNYLKV